MTESAPANFPVTTAFELPGMTVEQDLGVAFGLVFVLGLVFGSARHRGHGRGGKGPGVLSRDELSHRRYDRLVLVYAATKNAGKLRELRELFAGSGWQIEPYAGYGDVVEGETSYAANAALKATALRDRLLGDGIVAAVLGDDSGIEVRALDGRPGVLSARYAGSGATWTERRARLLAEVASSGSYPAITPSRMAASRTVRATGPTRSNEEANAISPYRLTLP